MDAVEVAAWDIEVARMLGACRGDQRVEFIEQARRRNAVLALGADMRVDAKLDGGTGSDVGPSPPASPMIASRSTARSSDIASA